MEAGQTKQSRRHHRNSLSSSLGGTPKVSRNVWERALDYIGLGLANDYDDMTMESDLNEGRLVGAKEPS